MIIHLIAIGGAIMHQLAIELHRNGHTITGSDDEIFEPAYTNLLNNRLLPTAFGWDENRIHKNIDIVILGMHAKADNPEYLKAQELGLKIMSFPEYIYEYSKDKKRVVVAGSHGKTSTTSMIMHVLQKNNIAFDYLVGAKVEGFDRSVKLSDAPIIILEGDEYPASVVEKRPKIHFYQPHISVLTGIEWDHINVFPTYDNYVSQFDIYLSKMNNDTTLIYSQDDQAVVDLVNNYINKIVTIPYLTPEYTLIDNKINVCHDDYKYPVSVFGNHNLQNMEAARLVCNQLGVSDVDFYHAIYDFTGAARRLEKLKENENGLLFRDFAHAPSKLRATLKAVRDRYHDYCLIACFELHTFSSLNKEFLAQYKDTLNDADASIVYFSKHALELKRLPMLSKYEVIEGFDNENIEVVSNPEDLLALINNAKNLANKKVCILMMSSGTYDGIDLNELL